MIVRTVPGRHQVHLVDGMILKGTIIFSGRRGLVIALDNRDLFVPRNRVLRTITSPKPSAAKNIDTESMPTDTLKTYHVIKRNGSYSLSNSVEKTANKQPNAENPLDSTKKITTTPLVSTKPGSSSGQPDKNILPKAQKALAAGKSLLAESMEAKSAKKANILRQKALALILQAENIFKQALRKSPGNKQIERNLQEAMRQRYWCSKMLRLSPGQEKTTNKNRKK